MDNTQNRRIIYIWPENVEFYNSLQNKSEVINRYLMQLQSENSEQLDIEEELQRKLNHIDATAADKLD